MSGQPKPKPWEANKSSSPSSSSSSSSTLEPIQTPPASNKHIQSGNANGKVDGTLHINPSGGSDSSSLSQQPRVPVQNPMTTTTTTTTTGVPIMSTEPYQTVQPYSMYGGGDYGMFGGNTMYNPYGGGMYGSYGNFGGGYGMMGGPNWGMNFMQSSVDNVGRFSSLLQMASQALHMTFSSLIQFAGGLAMITKEFGGFFSGIYLLRFFKYLWIKARNLIYWILRQKPPIEEQMEELFNASQANNNAQNRDKPSVVTMGFFAFGCLWLIQWIWNTVRHEMQQQQQKQQQMLAQQNQMNISAQNQLARPMPVMAYNTGGYAQYNNNPYSYMPSQQQQQQNFVTQTQTQTQAPSQSQSIEVVTNSSNTNDKNNTNVNDNNMTAIINSNKNTTGGDNTRV